MVLAACVPGTPPDPEKCQHILVSIALSAQPFQHTIHGGSSESHPRVSVWERRVSFWSHLWACIVKSRQIFHNLRLIEFQHPTLLGQPPTLLGQVNQMSIETQSKVNLRGAGRGLVEKVEEDDRRTHERREQRPRRYPCGYEP